MVLPGIESSILVVSGAAVAADDQVVPDRKANGINGDRSGNPRSEREKEGSSTVPVRDREDIRYAPHRSNDSFEADY
jgi:hypothetical protein